MAEQTAKTHSGDWLVLHSLGFGACWGWVHIAFFSTVLWGNASEELSLAAWLVNVFANACAMIGLGCLSVRRAPLGSWRGITPVLVVLTALGTLGLALGQSSLEPWVVVAAASSGVGTAGLLLLWAEAYRNIPPTYAKHRAIPASMTVGVFYYLIVGLLPHIAAIVATMLLPVISVVLLVRTRRMENVCPDDALFDGVPIEGASAEGSLSGALAARDRSGDAKSVSASSSAASARFSEAKGSPRIGRFFGFVRGAIPLRFAIVAAVYCLAPGFMRGYTSALPFVSTDGFGGAMFAGVAVVMIAIAVASVVLFGEAKIDLAYKLVVPLMAAGLLLLPFLAPGQEAVAAIAIMSGYILFEIYVWGSLSDRAANTGAPTALVFGFGKTGMNVGLLAGTFAGLRFGSSSSMLLVGVLVFIVYLFIVMENAMSPGLGVALSLSRSEEGERAPESSKVTLAEAAQMDLSEVFNAMLDERCAVVAERCGLSARETEVLGLLARGRSLQAIADVLGVAYSTVKTHTDRIYAKTGVHSRQELVALLERVED